MENFFKTLTSMKMMSILILIFAIAVGSATFIENDYGTDSAKVLIYNAKWFEFLLMLLTLNLIVNIFRFKLYKREKFAIFAFHLAFVFIFIGAGVTRYIGYEGSMPIKEGMVEDKIISTDSYFQLKVNDGEKNYYSEDKLMLAELGSHEFIQRLAIKDKKIDIELVEFIPNAVNSIVEDENGKPTLSLMISTGANPEAIFLSENEKKNIGGVDFCFDGKCDGVEFKFDGRDVYFRVDSSVQSFSMDTRETNELNATLFHKLENRQLYSTKEAQFVLKNFYKSASIKLIPAKVAGKMARGGTIDAFKFKFSVDGESKIVTVLGRNGEIGQPSHLDLKGLHFDITYGSKYIKLPFAIKLRDFQLERYPGSMSPSSYASEVSVVDGENSFDFRIYMNHILEYKGFRFYQASYEPDESGTILSVNHDYLGTLITYFGYWMLGIAMFLALLAPKGRFRKLMQNLSKVDNEKSSLMSLLVVALLMIFSSNLNAEESEGAKILKTIQAFDKTHSDKFSELLVQDVTGRIKPINTLSIEILNKVSRKSEFYGLTPNQIFLGMTTKPAEWQMIKMIRVSHPQINEILGLQKDEKYLAFIDFFGETEYKLLPYVEEANRKRPAFRDKFDKEVLKVDERMNICYMVYTGELLKIYPKPNDKDGSWYSPIEAMKSFAKEDKALVKNITKEYFESIDKALISNEWSIAGEKLSEIIKFQRFYGASIIQSDGKINAELIYNELNVFERLIPFYGIIGFILLILSFMHILNPKLNLDKVTKIAKYLLITGFIFHTVGLGLRWFISGHAPWSDGFESMIYISWATILAGLIFARKSSMTISATAILSALTLFVAHLSWMDSQISNLVPVLKSYWLTIHVSMITGSYGFLGLGAILGFINLILFILRKNSKFLDLSIKELTYINEMALIVGLILLTIGNFLGGVWANESWGRYWGWDPKETWTLVTMLVYVFILHMRFIPKLNSIYLFNVMSLIGFSSVIMTYFGVNFYLSGLHSYAKGDPVPIPDFVYYTVIVVFTIILLAFPKRSLK